MPEKLKPLPWQKLLKVFEQDGFIVDRERGDHLMLIKIGMNRPLVIPKYHAVPVFIIRNNLRTAGMSRERFFELLEGA